MIEPSYALGAQERSKPQKCVVSGNSALEALNIRSRKSPTVVTKNQKIVASKVQRRNSRKERADNDFIIPELPRGRLLEIKIYSNWGDKFVVGLNGIELFDVDGEIVNVEKVNSFLILPKFLIVSEKNRQIFRVDTYTKY